MAKDGKDRARAWRTALCIAAWLALAAVASGGGCTEGAAHAQAEVGPAAPAPGDGTGQTQAGPQDEAAADEDEDGPQQASEQPMPPAASPPAAAPSAAAPGAGKAMGPPASPGAGQSGFSALAEGWPAGSSGEPAAPEEQAPVPTMELTEEGRAFAGRWVAAVINRGGQARLLASEDEWVFNLGLDARCAARQRVDGQYWEQSGWWQVQGDTLTLSLGPGGVWVFGLQRSGGDIAIWSRTAEDAGGVKYTLFCVRTPEATMPPGLATNYSSDYGPLRFQPTGPGHWRTAYGDPAGKLRLSRVGTFLAGQWEQPPGSGFAIFRSAAKPGAGAAQALDGVWWYAGSTSFDGTWKASRAR